MNDAFYLNNIWLRAKIPAKWISIFKFKRIIDKTPITYTYECIIFEFIEDRTITNIIIKEKRYYDTLKYCKLDLEVMDDIPYYYDFIKEMSNDGEFINDDVSLSKYQYNSLIYSLETKIYGKPISYNKLYLEARKSENCGFGKIPLEIWKNHIFAYLIEFYDVIKN